MCWCLHLVAADIVAYAAEVCLWSSLDALEVFLYCLGHARPLYCGSGAVFSRCLSLIVGSGGIGTIHLKACKPVGDAGGS